MGSLAGFSPGPSSDSNAASEALLGPPNQITSASQTAKKCNLSIKCAAYTKPRSDVSLVSPEKRSIIRTVPFSLTPFCIYNIIIIVIIIILLNKLSAQHASKHCFSCCCANLNF